MHNFHDNLKETSPLTVIIEFTNTGLSAYIKEVDGLTTVGDSLGEIKRNINEVIQYELEYLEEQGEEVPKITDLKINYVIDLEQFFSHYKVINKTAFAAYTGINPGLFRQYAKGLVPISDKRMEQISKGLQKLSDDLNHLQLA
ncbi:type II toxin-antitoxin system HicB family antitoxin [Zunongwangia sp. H14]|uniref:type II toxin-antitoxin system HicB family antitoxin n=1 Tax=Zunongwangia sp. H14 TaxID=3240792 RepID=UPI003568A3DB